MQGRKERIGMLPGKWKDWEVVEELGSGSYGTVYQIEKDDRTMAVKVIEIPQKNEYNQIMKEHGRDAEAYCRSIAQNFETEIRTLEMLRDCENIITIEDYIIEKKEDDIGWTIFIVMECLESFPEYSISRVIDEEILIRMAIEITTALCACEEKGVMHRDIKPENILVDQNGRFLLCDFGLARQFEYKKQVSSVKGTYKYMAPEVYHGQAYDGTADIYSLGLILYEYMNRRRMPFIPADKKMVYFKDQEESLASRMSGEVMPAPCEASAELSDIILRMTAFQQEDRYKSAKELLKDLQALKKGSYRISRESIFQRHKKKIISLSALSAIVLICLSWYSSPVWKDKACGDSARCSLSRSGTLTISGKGDVSYPDPWYEEKEKIKKIVVEEGITSLGTDSGELFADSYHLQSLVLPKSLEDIGDSMFSNCKNLTDVEFPENIQYCGSDAFYGTPWLKDQFHDDHYAVVNGCILDYDRTQKDIVIPEGVEYIQSEIFDNDPLIRSIVFPDSLNEIADGAFLGCSNLEKVSFGKGITYIGTNAFADTKWIHSKEWIIENGMLLAYNGSSEKLSIPEGVTAVSDGVFYGNPFIKEVLFPKSLKEIRVESFHTAPLLQKITFRGDVSIIENLAFANCPSLSEVIFEKEIREIGINAFSECIRLKSITISKDTKLDHDKQFAGNGDPFYGCDGIKIIRK